MQVGFERRCEALLRGRVMGWEERFPSSIVSGHPDSRDPAHGNTCDSASISVQLIVILASKLTGFCRLPWLHTIQSRANNIVQGSGSTITRFVHVKQQHDMDTQFPRGWYNLLRGRKEHLPFATVYTKCSSTMTPSSSARQCKCFLFFNQDRLSRCLDSSARRI